MIVMERLVCSNIRYDNAFRVLHSSRACMHATFKVRTVIPTNNGLILQIEAAREEHMFDQGNGASPTKN